MKLLPETFKMREQFSDSFVQVMWCVGLLVHESEKVCLCACVCVCARVRACVRVCVREKETVSGRDDGEDWQKAKH